MLDFFLESELSEKNDAKIPGDKFNGVNSKWRLTLNNLYIISSDLSTDIAEKALQGIFYETGFCR